MLLLDLKRGRWLLYRGGHWPSTGWSAWQPELPLAGSVALGKSLVT